MQPYNYVLPQQATASDSLMQGYQQGLGIQQVQAQRQAQQAAAQQQAQMQADLAAASRDPALIPQVMVRYPQLAEKLKHGWDAMSTDQQRANLEHGSQVLTALESKRPDLAVQLMRDRATALRNSGDEQQAKLVEAMAQSAESAPDLIKQATLLRIGALPGGDKIIEGITKMRGDQRAQEMQPAAVAKGEAEAKTAQVKAKFAESDALADLETKGWNIKKLQADIASDKERNRIAAMSAAIAREGNSLQRQKLQLEVDRARSELDNKARERVGEFEASVSTLADARQLIQEIKSNESAFSGATGTTAWLAGVPGSPEKTVAGKIEQLQNLLALPGLDKLKGPTSDRDIAFLRNIATNLDRYQGTGAVSSELDKVDAAISRLAKAAAKKYGAPEPNLDRGPVTPVPGWGAGANKKKEIVVDW